MAAYCFVICRVQHAAFVSPQGLARTPARRNILPSSESICEDEMENRRIKRAAWVFAGFLAANLLSSLLSSTTQVNLLRSATVAALFAAGYLLVTSRVWKRYVLRLKDID
jgi:hypothetical protein